MKALTLVLLIWSIWAAHHSPEFLPIHRTEIASCDSAALFREQLIDLVNQARTESRYCGELFYPSAAPLIWNENLEMAARIHSIHMATQNFFAHRGPDSTHVGNRVDALGYNWRVIGENIFAGVEDASEVVYGWLDSPGHCKNIMNPDFIELGMACVQNPASQYEQYWTQVFASPMWE